VTDSLAGIGAESDVGIEVIGRAEGVHHQTSRGRHTGRGSLPSGQDQPGDLLQLEEEVLRADALGGAAAARVAAQMRISRRRLSGASHEPCLVEPVRPNLHNRSLFLGLKRIRSEPETRFRFTGK